MSATTARFVLRSATARTTSLGSRLGSGLKPNPNSTRSSFNIPKQNALSNRLFRMPLEMSCCVETMLPYHTATASALLTSMISLSRSSCWTPEGKNKTR